MSSSSSECSEDERLREAVDVNHCKLYAKDRENGEEESRDTIKRPSKRVIREEETEPNSELKVTRGFQKYVAKHLDQIIERRIKYSKRNKEKLSAPSCLPDDGVHLFSTSQGTLKVEEDDRKKLPKRKKKFTRIPKSHERSSSEEDEKLREAAVSSDWVLQKKGAY